MDVKRGEVWYADLGHSNGSEQRGRRPVLVIQNNVGNEFSPTIIVAALTDNRKKYLPTHVPVPKSEGVEKDSVVLLEQIRTIDKSLLIKRVCELSEDTMIKVNYAIRVSMGVTRTPVEIRGRKESRG